MKNKTKVRPICIKIVMMSLETASAICSLIGNQRHSWLYPVLFLICWQGGFTQIKCNSDIFIGGVPNYDDVKKNSGILKPFSGSIQKVQATLPHVHGVTLTTDNGIENCDQCKLLYPRKKPWGSFNIFKIIFFNSQSIPFQPRFLIASAPSCAQWTSRECNSMKMNFYNKST